jgi:hypothetical protein
MGQGNYDQEICGQCRKKVDSICWLAPIRTSVCYKCREAYETSNPNWRIDEARKMVDRAYEAYVNACEDLEDLLKDTK